MNKKITFIISSKDHPINSFIYEWISKNSIKYDIQIEEIQLKPMEEIYAF